MSADSLVRDASGLVVASALAATLLVVWLSIVVSLWTRATRPAALLAALVVPAPLLAWRAGLHKRAIVMVVAFVLYVGVRVFVG